MNAIAWGIAGGLFVALIIVAVGVTAAAWIAIVCSLGVMLFGAVDYVNARDE